MNPLTLVKRIQDINKKEAALGISDEASWHAKYKDSAYVYVGGIPFDLTEGDLLAVFAQYGELVDVNLIRDKGTGKSKGFAFLAYEDQRSTNLAVDNLNGAQILGRTIRVDHVNKYKKLEEEDEETKQQKREERGVCRAFQRGNCNRGDSCKFSHDEQRAANTGWGAEEDRPSTWVKDKYENSNEAQCICRAFQRGNCNRGDSCKFSHDEQRAANTGWGAEEDNSSTWVKDKYENSAKDGREREHRSGNRDSRSSEPKRKEPDSAAYTNERSRPPRNEPNSREERDRRKDYSSRKYDSESYHREEKYGKERENRSYRDRDASQHRHRRERDD